MTGRKMARAVEWLMEAAIRAIRRAFPELPTCPRCARDACEKCIDRGLEWQDPRTCGCGCWPREGENFEGRSPAFRSGFEIGRRMAHVDPDSLPPEVRAAYKLLTRQPVSQQEIDLVIAADEAHGHG